MITMIIARPWQLRGQKPDLTTKAQNYIYPRIDFYVHGDNLYIFMRAGCKWAQSC